MYIVRRHPKNPRISPNSNISWAAHATFNGCPIKVGGHEHIVFRAMSRPDKMGEHEFALSTIAVAIPYIGGGFSEPYQFIVPEYDWEQFGCEDPRVTYFEGKYYTFYTAISAFPFCSEGIKVGLAVSQNLKDPVEKHLITPFNAKAMMLFPERIGGKIFVLVTANTDTPPSKIAWAAFDTIEEVWSESFWKDWYAHIDQYTLGDLRRLPSDHVELGAVPVKTKHGWLLVYSHIQNYFDEKKRIFGIEALLLDLDNPAHVIARTSGPIIVPEEIYETNGVIPNVIFPSGAVLEKDILRIIYGGADTVICEVRLNFSHLLESMLPSTKGIIERNPLNPIVAPTDSWQEKEVFNPAAFEHDGKVHILYRAMDNENTSVIGHAISSDGFNINSLEKEPIYVPRTDFEIKKIPHGNSGCEDPRVTLVKDTLYMLYTAYNGIDVPAVAATSIKLKDFLNKKYDWTSPVLISPWGIDDKDACILPEKIKGRYLFIHRMHHCICADYLDSLDFTVSKAKKCIRMIEPRPGMWDSQKIGLASPPLKVSNGWIMFYHGISDTGEYALGAVLLDKDDPSIILSRTNTPIMRPVMDYEKKGIVPNVVFPCGAVEKRGYIYIYYGGADKYVCSARVKTGKLIEILKPRI